MNTLPTVNIKGKKYVTVNERLKYFRENHKKHCLETEIIEVTNETALMRAVIRDDRNEIVATGVAREERNDTHSFVNKTSYVENCETSAWGRALANFGIGIDETVASADELVNAISTKGEKPPKTVSPPKKQPESLAATPEQIKNIKELAIDLGTTYETVCKEMSQGYDPNKAQATQIIPVLKQKLSDKIDAAA